MTISKNTVDVLFLQLIFVSAVIEKLAWRIAGFNCSLYMIVGIILIIYSLLTSKFKFVFYKNFSQLLFIKCLLLLLVAGQFFYIDLNDLKILDLYVKGFSLKLLDLCTFIAVFYIISRISVDSFSVLLTTFSILGIVNILFNGLQLINPNFDEFYKVFFFTDVERLGLNGIRITGLFTDANNNGVFLILSTISFLCLSCSKSLLVKACYIVLSIVACVFAVMTCSRTVWIGLVVFLLLYMHKINKKGKIIILSLVTLGMCLLIDLYNTEPVVRLLIDDRTETLSVSSIGYNSHYVILFEAFDMWLKNTYTFFFGVGCNLLGYYYGIDYLLPGYKAHCYYVQILSEYGVIGLFLTCSFIGYLFHLINRSSPNGFFLFAMLITLLSVNFTYDSMMQPMYTMIISLIVTHYKIYNVFKKI